MKGIMRFSPSACGHNFRTTTNICHYFLLMTIIANVLAIMGVRRRIFVVTCTDVLKYSALVRCPPDFWTLLITEISLTSTIATKIVVQGAISLVLICDIIMVV
jgi:hypothetical protein